MAWVTPTDVNPGDAILASLYNQDVVANTNYLKAEADAVGLVHLRSTSFSATATIDIDDVFSADYLNYLLLFNAETSAAGIVEIRFQFRTAGGATTLASGYYWAATGFTSGNSASNDYGANLSYGTLGYVGGSGNGRSLISATIGSPFATNYSWVTTQNVFRNSTTVWQRNYGTSPTSNGAYAGIRIALASNITGTIKIYGMRDA